MKKYEAMTQLAPIATVHGDFLRFLENFNTLGSNEQSAILDCVTVIKAKKGTKLVTEGEVCRDLFYVHRGAAHLYYHKGDKRVTSWLSLDDSLITSVESLTDPNMEARNIELLEDSVIVKLPFEGLNRLYDRYHDIERLGRLLTTHYLQVMSQKMHRNYFLTAKEAYDQLLEEYPEVAWRVPLGVIASYLGINQATLSRIRRPDYGH